VRGPADIALAVIAVLAGGAVVWFVAMRLVDRFFK